MSVTGVTWFVAAVCHQISLTRGEINQLYLNLKPAEVSHKNLQRFIRK